MNDTINNKSKINFIGKETSDIKIIESALRSKEKYVIVSSYMHDESDKKVVNFRKVDDANIYILSLSKNWENEMESIKKICNIENTPLLVFGPENTKAMREAMRLGVEDYYSSPDQIDELDSQLDIIVKQLASKKTQSKGQSNATRQSIITTVINTAGGSGASFIAANIAHLFATQHNQNVGLIDMDYQFGSHALNWDLTLKYSLSEVLENIGNMDSTALPAFFSKHKSGLHILGEKLDDLILPGELSPENIEQLIALSKQAFDHTVIDLPRQIDPLFASTVSKSNRIILVMQQTLAHVRDTKRLLTILTQEFEIPSENITVILNRYDEEHAITIKDIAATINHRPLIVLPNDYKRAVKAVEAAKPFVEFAPATPLAKAFTTVTQDLTGAPSKVKAKDTLLKRAVAAIVGN